MDYSFSRTAYRSFLLWGVCSALGAAASTLVDAVLIGNFVGSRGLAATNAATPVFLVFGLFAVTLATGGGILIGRCLGANEKERAQSLFGQLLALGLLGAAVFTGLGLLFPQGIIRLLGVRDPAVAELSRIYLGPVFACAALFLFYHFLSCIVRSVGFSRTAAASAAVLVVLNIVLDWYFMRPCGLGIRGASLALCLSTAAAVAILLSCFFRRGAPLRLRPERPRTETAARFVKNGLGTGSPLLFRALVIALFNSLLALGAQGTLNMAYFGVLCSMSTLASAVFEGSAAAMTPVAAIFLGEKDARGVTDVFHLALRTALAAGLALSALFAAFAPALVRLFGLTGEDAALAASAFRVFALSLLPTGVNTVLIAFWQSISRWKLAGVAAALRSLLLPGVFGLLLIPRAPLNGLGMAYLCCEGLCLLLFAAVGRAAPSERVLHSACRSVERSFEKTYEMLPESIEAISGDFEALTQEWEIDANRAFFLNLMVEELMLNIMKFGLSSQARSKRAFYIAVKLIEDGGDYILRIRDNVADYNPFESQGDAIDNAAIHIIRKKAKYYDYQRKLVFNYLYLVL